MNVLMNRKMGFLGFGNMNRSIAEVLMKTHNIEPSQVGATNRSPGKLLKFGKIFPIQQFSTNEELIEFSDILFLGVKPQDLHNAVEPVASTFHEKHIVISLAAGICLKDLRKLMPTAGAIIRLMPNTPLSIKKAVLGYAIEANQENVYRTFLDSLLSPLGTLVEIEEGERFEALTVACGSGVGFVFQLMIYWTEWLEEHGFDSCSAQKLTVQTFLGAAELANQSPSIPLADLKDKVVSKKGVTAAGLESMEELELERGIRYSFEKAALRDRQLGQT